MIAARVARFGRFNQNILCVVRVKTGNGRRSKHRDDRNISRNANVHWSRIRRKKQNAFIQKSRNFRQSQFARENFHQRVIFFVHFLNASRYHFFVHRSAEKRHTVTAPDKFIRANCKIIVKPTFGKPTCTDIEGDNFCIRRKVFVKNFFCRAFIFFTYPHFQTAVIKFGNSETFAQYVKMRFNLML